jgi:hypothetical protein
VLNRKLCSALVAVLALVAVACKEEAPAPAKETPPPPPAAAPAPPPAAAPAPPDAAPPPPALPSDPKELVELRKKAILEGRLDDALKICAAEDVAKIGDQSILSCVLAACAQKDVDHAQTWAKLLNGPLKTQAKKTCLAYKVPI